MGRKSTETRYGSVAVTIHWLSAILIVFLFGSGFRAEDATDTAAKVFFLQFHVPAGLLILLLTLTRIGWWVFADNKPQPVSMPAWQDRLARVAHILLYVVILGMASSGIGIMVLSGAGAIIFAGEPGPLPDLWQFLPRTPHAIAARVLIVLLVLHAGAALYHHFVTRDGLLRRMWFSQ